MSGLVRVHITKVLCTRHHPGVLDTMNGKSSLCVLIVCCYYLCTAFAESDPQLTVTTSYGTVGLHGLYVSVVLMIKFYHACDTINPL